MLDVFVVSLLTGLVQIQGFAVITAGVGIAAFGSVVVLTMLASLSFDPKLTWDSKEAQALAHDVAQGQGQENSRQGHENRDEKPA
jgi:paraquat-inducible protein A